MIDKVNRFFAFLAKQHCLVYGFLGVLIAFLFLHNVEYQLQIPILKKLIFPVLFIFVISRFLLYGFYEKREIGCSKIPMTTSIVVKDDYFLEKITGNISAYKKLTGYIYVIFRIMDAGAQGFVVGLGLLMLLQMGV